MKYHPLDIVSEITLNQNLPAFFIFSRICSTVCSSLSSSSSKVKDDSVVVSVFFDFTSVSSFPSQSTFLRKSQPSVMELKYKPVGQVKVWAIIPWAGTSKHQKYFLQLEECGKNPSSLHSKAGMNS